jgi:hypothetical protein
MIFIGVVNASIVAIASVMTILGGGGLLVAEDSEPTIFLTALFLLDAVALCHLMHYFLI